MSFSIKKTRRWWSGFQIQSNNWARNSTRNWAKNQLRSLLVRESTMELPQMIASRGKRRPTTATSRRQAKKKLWLSWRQQFRICGARWCPHERPRSTSWCGDIKHGCKLLNVYCCILALRLPDLFSLPSPCSGHRICEYEMSRMPLLDWWVCYY